MAQIRCSGNKSTENRLISIFRASRLIGWRRNQSVFGKPDFVFKKQKLAVFVDGCFWHGCPKCYRAPKSNQQYWQQKIIRNRKRDLNVNRILRSQGWKVFRFWECGLRAEKRIVNRLKNTLR
jgi:DNA mismatch endonuclease (patch repair protein)